MSKPAFECNSLIVVDTVGNTRCRVQSIAWLIRAKLIETLLALTDVTSMEINEIIFALTCPG